jgi:short subunit dehydrogenase-like uncharacterized protein
VDTPFTAGTSVAVIGAYGHTGRFVLRELHDRGHASFAVGRDERRLQALRAAASSSRQPELHTRTASADDPGSLDRALDGASAVINCAGPFAETASPVIEAALRRGIPYVDVAAEIEANLDTFSHFADRARATGAVIVPAMAFFGGLADLLTTAAISGDSEDPWTAIDEVHIAYGLSSWHPTAGTRTAGRISRQRRDGRAVRYTGGRLEYYDHENAAAEIEWDFPEPIGTQKVVPGFTMADVVTIPGHLPVRDIETYMAAVAATDVSSPETPAPAAVDDRGRSAQRFVVDVTVHRNGQRRRAIAAGQDIYAATAPLAVEAVERILTGRTKVNGVASAGEIFDAADFLRSLVPHIAFERRQPAELTQGTNGL